MSTIAPTATTCHNEGCGGIDEATRRPLVQRHGGALAIVDAVPLLRCPIGGDEYMELATAECLDRLAAAPPDAKDLVPVYAFPDEEAPPENKRAGR